MHYTESPLFQYARDKSAPAPGSELDALYAAFNARHSAANLPAGYSSYTLKTSPVADEITATARVNGKDIRSTQDIREYLTKFTESFRRDGGRVKSMYIYSRAKGNGKTTTASALLNEYLIADFLAGKRNQAPGFFLDVNEWQTLFNGFNRSHVPPDRAEKASAKYYAWMDRAQFADFAVLDDIGVRAASEAFRGDLHSVINYRTVNGLPTVYTSNIAVVDLEMVFDERLADRVRDQCFIVEFADTESKRGIRK